MNVLVLCTGNSCRSQMAEGFLRHYLPENFVVRSAGIEKHGLNLRAVTTMAEVDIDISNHYSKTLEEVNDIEYDLVLTVCDNANESCPIYPVKTKKIHQNFTDPSKLQGSEIEILTAFRQCRDEISQYCKKLSEELVGE